MNNSIEQIKADYHLFIDIQMGKYLKSVNRSEFNSDAEAKNILDKIIESYNKQIAPEHDRLDNSTNEAKAAWFNSIQIDFHFSGSDSNSLNYKSKLKETTPEVIKFYDKVFPFLPPGNILFVLLAVPALEAYGYPYQRFSKLLEGEKPSAIEKDILRWGYTITLYLMSAFIEKKEADKKKALSYAIETANKELDELTTQKVISEINDNINEHFASMRKSKNKKKKN